MGTDPVEVRAKGLDYAMAGDMESAFAYFERATQLAPNDPGYWSDLGVTQMRMGMLDEAKESFVTSKELQPSKLVEDNLKALQEHLDWRDHGKAPERAEPQGSADTGGVGGASGVDEASAPDLSEVHLNQENYSDMVEASSDIWLVEYYSGMCGSCKEFLPTWHDVSTSFRELRAARVNIDDKAGMKLAQSQGVLDHGIPAVRLSGGGLGGKAELLMGGKKLLDAPALTAKIRAALDRYAPRDL